MKKPDSPSSASVIRQKAEELVKIRKQKTDLPKSEADILKLINELEVRQIELELHNEELVQTTNYNEDLIKSLFEDNHSVILYIDAETGDIRKANPAACRYYGWSHAELCKKNISEINTLSQAEVAIEMQKAKDEKRNHFLFKHRLASGEIRDVEVYSGPVNLNNSILLYSFIQDVTERKIAEEKLLKSEETYRKLVETINDVVYEITSTGVIKYISPSIIRILGISREDLIGKNIIQFIYEEDRPMIINRLANLMEKDYSYLEYRYMNKNGEICWVRSSTSAIIENGLLVGGAGTLTDITERKLAEEMLQNERILLRTVIDNIPDVIYAKDSNGRLTLSNKADLQMLKASSESEVIGKTDFEFFPKELADAFFADEQLIIQTGKPLINKEEYVVDEKEETRCLLTSKSPLHDLNGQVIGLIGIGHDITRRKQAEEVLIDSESKYRNIFESIQDVYYEARIDGTLIDLSPSIEIISKGQYKREDLIGKSLLGFYSNPDDRNILISELFKQGSVTDYELSFLNKDGSSVPMAVSSRLIYDADGNPFKIAGSMRDITERKQTEFILKQSNQKWEAIIAASPDGIGIVTLDGKLELASNKLASMFGYSLQEKDLFIGKSVFEFIDTSDHKKLIGNMRKLLDNEHEQTVSEYLAIRRDKSTFHTELNSSILYDKKGNPENILYVQRDISSRKMAEEYMRENEEKYRNIFINAQEGIFQTNLDGTYRSVNPALAKMYGFESPEELISSRSDISKDTYFDPNERENFLKSMEVQGYVKGYEYEVKRKDGGIIWLFEDAKAIKDKNGSIQYFEGFVVDITERKLIENEIKDKSTLLTNLIINLKEGILLEDADRKIVLTNQLFCDMFGIPAPPEVMVGADCSSSAEESKNFFKNPDQFIADINLVLEEKKAVFNDELELADGRYFERDYIPNYLENKYNGHLWKYRDITDRRKVEEGFKKISQAVEQSPVMNYITDLSGVIEYVNPKVIELTGYFREELIGQNPSIFSTGEKSKEEYANLYRTISSGIEWKGEFHNRRKNGEFFWVSALISPVTDSKGKITHYLAVEEDITERKEKDKELQKLSLAVEQSPVIIVITDLNGNIEYVNPAFQAITGYRFNEVSGKNTSILKSGQTKPEVYKNLWNNIEAGNDWYGEWMNKKKNGDLFWENVSITPIRDESGKITNYLAVKQDITQRKQAEKEINDLNANLEDKIVERTAQLAHTNVNLLNEIEERKRIEIALGESEKSYRTVIENVNEIIFQTDAEGLWLFLNKSWEDITGFSVDESLGQLFVNYVHPDDRARNWELFEPLINRKKDYCRHEIRYLTKSGGFRWVEVFARLGLNEQDEITGTFGTLQDITERREAEYLLEQTRQNYETFFNTIDDFLFVLDEQGNMIHTNKAVTNRLSYSREELISHSVLMVHPEERRDEAGRIVGEMLAGTADYCPVPLITKAGKHIPVETRVKPGFWDGKPVIFGVSKDVSQIKLSEEKFSKAFQSNSAMMAISIASTGKFLEINDAYVKTTGYSREEMIGQTSANLNIYEDSETREKIYETLRQKIPVKELEVKIRTKSGQVITGIFSADYIVIGNQNCILALMVDITDRKKAEEDLKKARREAEQANMAKSEFLSRMSHELRTPMNSILGFAQLLEMGELNLRQKKGVNHILKSGNHLLDLINEVLDISSIEAGRISLSLEAVQLSIIIPEMLDIVRPLAEKRHISLHVGNSITNQLFVKSDRQRLKQVLLNLLNNAIKYNKDGGSVTIKTELRRETDSDRSFLRITITDTGLGISSKDIPKLFMPFERIGAEKTKTEGTGLGLSVAKKLMQAMGGNLGVESSLDKGSSFWFELPQSESPFNSINKNGELNDTELKLADKTGTILYIEDNASNVELIEQILENQHSGIRLITTINGNEAVKLALEYLPDLILLDLNLPDIHGSKVLKLLKAEKKIQNISVVVISADAMPQQQERLLRAGALKYLTKPLDIKAFMNVVDLFIPGNSAQIIS